MHDIVLYCKINTLYETLQYAERKGLVLVGLEKAAYGKRPQDDTWGLFFKKKD